MAALTAGRRTQQRAGDIVSHPLAAAAVIHQGGLACLSAAGYLVPGATATTLTCVGIAAESVSNAGGAAGAVCADVRRDGAWRFDNAAADPVGRPHIGKTAWIVDDQTVAATDGGGTRSAAGTVIDIDADGVWIEF
ncbi:hypothetical protein [Azospirillum halopraeferens]|uniref:hypothetical protein n=1 Tax=Azospirillum halopraeferens TaxID=34010 RepID=UPI0003F70DF6|nr:hypothetical protein [Azospirillum halopraeferens]